MPDHGEATLTVQITATGDKVWSLIRRFDAVAAWNPFLAESRLVSGTTDGIGAEREVTTADGAVVRERLVELDETHHALSYELRTFPIPVTAQRNRIVVASGNGEGVSRVTFSAWFVPAPGASIADVAALNRAAFAAAADGIGRHLGRDATVVG